MSEKRPALSRSVLVSAIDRLTKQLWKKSQADNCRIREAGTMQDHVRELRQLCELDPL